MKLEPKEVSFHLNEPMAAPVDSTTLQARQARYIAARAAGPAETGSRCEVESCRSGGKSSEVNYLESVAHCSARL